MKKKWFLELLGRRLIIVVLLLVQIAFIGYLIITGSRTFHIVNWILNLLSLAVALYIISKKEKGAYKLTWIILILVFPLFGGLWYLIHSKIFCFYQKGRRKSCTVVFLARRQHRGSRNSHASGSHIHFLSAEIRRISDL